MIDIKGNRILTDQTCSEIGFAAACSLTYLIAITSGCLRIT